mgnify:CR=1 FL=1
MEANGCCSSEQHRQTKGRGFTAVLSRTTSSPPAEGNLGAGFSDRGNQERNCIHAVP